MANFLDHPVGDCFYASDTSTLSLHTLLCCVARLARSGAGPLCRRSNWLRGTLYRIVSVIQHLSSDNFRKLLQSVNQSINHHFTVRPNVNQRAGQLNLPYVGATKTGKNITKIEKNRW